MSSEHTPPVPPSDPAKPPELHFLLPEEQRNLKLVFGGPGLSYVAFGLVVLLVAWLRPDLPVRAELPEFDPQDIVFLDTEGPGGGGGGGGSRSPEPPKTEKTPVVKPPEPEPVPIPKPNPVPPPEPEKAAEIEAITPAVELAVVDSAPTAAPSSLGTGDDGAGKGRGGGVGPGAGDGLGPGRGGNFGGDVFQPGNGVSNPILVASARPNYTSEAMLRRTQGEVHLNCVVLATGSVGECDVVKSLPGLDNEAINAARKFRFRPGERQGEPVNVLVRIEIAFNMR
jgi:periplasmic protein TonB